jgi:hypothetical protein
MSSFYISVRLVPRLARRCMVLILRIDQQFLHVARPSPFVRFDVWYQRNMTSTVSGRPAEVNAGTTTSWLPMSTAWPSIPGCESSLWKFIPTLAGWDPGYGISAQPGLSCQPPQVTTWWDRNVDASIQFSLGPVVCPEAYSTATTSLNAGGSTFVGCCPR